MTWQRSLNAALQRATGARLTRETPEQRRAEAARIARKAAAKAKRETAARFRRRIATLERKHERDLLRQQLRRRKRREMEVQDRQARQARGEDLPAHLDDEARRIIATVRPRTMTDPAKLHALVEATRHVVRHRVPGEIVECGVWRGGSMQAVALALLGADEPGRQLHLFDTFEGMPPPTEHDVRSRDGEAAEDLLATHDKDTRVWAYADLADVQQGMAETGYPAHLIHYHPGRVEETVPAQAPQRIALLRLDTDWYESTRHELEHLYDRLSPGGLLVLDDYGDWEGARKATEEWLDKTGVPLFLAPMGSGRIAVKPQ